MGLDMYLNRMPRHKGATAEDVRRVEHYLDWLRKKGEGNEYAKCSFKEWCGHDKAPSQDDLEFYSDYYHVYYSDWDKEKTCPWYGIIEEVGYWRKANQNNNILPPICQNGCHQKTYKQQMLEDVEKRNPCVLLMRM